MEWPTRLVVAISAFALAAAVARADAPPPPGAQPPPALEAPEPPPLPPYFVHAPPAPPVEKAHDTTLLLNAAALAGNPFARGSGWRVEAVVEQRIRRQSDPSTVQSDQSTAVFLSAGQATVPGFAPALALGFGGQVRSYFVGSFDRGAYVGGHLGFWYLGGRSGVAPGAVVGLKSVTRLATVDLQLCAGWPVDFTPARAGEVPFRDAWRVLAPGLLVGVGLSL
jgi:hypothetical protein